VTPERLSHLPMESTEVGGVEPGVVQELSSPTCSVGRDIVAAVCAGVVLLRWVGEKRRSEIPGVSVRDRGGVQARTLPAPVNSVVKIGNE
jgi:hypothetical protein